jgi:hypothetical protein
MISFKNFKPDDLNEKFKNFIGPNSVNQKNKYADEVYAMLNKAYAKIGGVKGSGFESAKAMTHKIPFWKLGFMKDELKIVMLFKDTGGRKLVALGTDGTKEARKMLASALKSDLNRAYKEFSDGIWKFSRKFIGDAVLLQFVVPVSKVRELLKKKTILDMDQVPDEFKGDIVRNDPFYKYYYGREIGGEIHVKIMIGTDGLPIES